MLRTVAFGFMLTAVFVEALVRSASAADPSEARPSVDFRRTKSGATPQNRIAPAVVAGHPARKELPISGVNHDGTQFEYSSLRDIQDPLKVSGLVISSGALRDDDLAFLSRAKALEALWLPGYYRREPARITDSGLRKIAELHNLTNLNLCSDRITDRGLAELARLTNLRWLGLRSSSITDAGIAQLRNLPSLMGLVLRVPNMTDVALADVATLERLISLDVCGTAVTGVGFSNATTPRQILFLFGDFTDQGLSCICRSNRLALKLLQLGVVGPRATDAGIAELANLRVLKHLYLQDTLVTEQAIGDLRRRCLPLQDIRVASGGRRPFFGGVFERARGGIPPAASRQAHLTHAHRPSTFATPQHTARGSHFHSTVPARSSTFDSD